jgi:hypothetical protein
MAPSISPVLAFSFFQRDRRAEHRHDPVTGPLCDRAAVPLHHRRAAVGELGHDLAQPLRTHRRGDVHRVDHVGEQHRHLLVLGMCIVRRNRSTALITELRVRRQFSAARPAHQGCRRHLTGPAAVVQVAIVSPLAGRHVRYRGRDPNNGRDQRVR